MENQSTVRWENFPHDADIGVRGEGNNVAEAFEQAALALTAIITDPEKVRPVETIKIMCEAPCLELLLVDWLNALVFEMATRGILFSRFEVNIAGERLNAVARGELINIKRHEPAAEIKGATMTELSVLQREDGSWCAQCVVDV